MNIKKLTLTMAQYLELKDSIENANSNVFVNAKIINANKVIVSVEYDVVQKDYRIIAKNEGDIISYYDGEVDLTHYRGTCHCEHCNVRRYRDNLYIVENTKTHEIKQVGTSCIQKYTDLDRNYLINEYSIIMQIRNAVDSCVGSMLHDGGSCNMRDGSYYELYDVVCRAYCFIKKNGYSDISKMDFKNGFFTIDIKDCDIDFDAFNTYFIEKAKDSTNAFIKTCESIVTTKYVKGQRLGIAFWMVNDFITNSTNGKEYYGNVGDRVKGEHLEIVNVKEILVENPHIWYATVYTSLYILTVKDANDKEYVLVHKTDSINYQIGDVLTTFTIKQHKDYEGTKQTVILRAKIKPKE